MSYPKILFLLTALVLLHLTGLAQTQPEKDYEACVTELKARCPIEYTDGWAILSFTDQEDTTRVALAFPSVLNGFLPALTTDTQNARKLWVRQMYMFGSDWKTFVRLLLAARRTLVLDFILGAGEDGAEGYPVATMTFLPEDFD